MPSQTELANAIRVLAMDAVQAAKSGHPGAPMGMPGPMPPAFHGTSPRDNCHREAAAKGSKKCVELL